MRKHPTGIPLCPESMGRKEETDMNQNAVTTETLKQNQITEGVIWKQLLLFFFPILFGTFFQQLYNTADAVIVGRFVGKEALAAVGGPTGPLINLLIGFFIGLSSGAGVIISQFYGARQEGQVSRPYRNGFFYPMRRHPDGSRHPGSSLCLTGYGNS